MRSLSLDDGPEVTFSPSTTGTIGGAGCVQSLDDEQEVTPSLSTLVTGTVARRFVLFCFVIRFSSDCSFWFALVVGAVGHEISYPASVELYW